MARTTQSDWLRAGLEILAKHGAPALTIDRLTLALSMTKGSFYHHFKGFSEYKTALLTFFEAELTTQIIGLAEQQRSADEKLGRLLEVVAAAPPELEVAVRAWALQDAEVERVQARVDAQRIAYIQRLGSQLLGDEARAALLGQIAYAMYVGSAQIRPPLSAAARRAMFDELRRLYHTKSV